MKTLHYRSPVNGETVELWPDPISGEWGIELGDDVSQDDLSTARVTITCLVLAVPLWAVTVWLLT